MTQQNDTAFSDYSEATAGDFLSLLKPRVMSLVVFTAVVGLAMAPGGLHPFLALVAILCIAVGAGASGALNMWYDADIDAVMSRTRSRAIPSGRLCRDDALAFGLILSAMSVVTLGLATNWIAAGLLAFTIFFYAVVYTIWLKRHTSQNIVIGGAAGAFPPMIGWAAVTGSISVESMVLFSLIFLWTPPHFWALALFKSGDYERARIPMLPNVAGHKSTKMQIVVYAALTAVCSILPWALGFASFVYGLISTGLGLGFVALAVKVLQMDEADTRMIPAKRLFGFSLLYLFSLFALLLIEALISRIV